MQKGLNIDIEEFFSLYGDKLKNAEDVKRLLEEASDNGKSELVSELTFKAKYSKGLMNIIRQSNQEIDAEYFQKMEAEYLTVITSIRDLLRELTISNNFLNSVFEKKYFKMTHQSLDKLNSFCNDLSYLKLYLNDLKKQSSV